MTADNKPLINDLAAKLHIIVSPKNTKLKRSGDLNFKAISAKTGAIKYRHKKLNKPPIKLAIIAIPSALPPSPLGPLPLHPRRTACATASRAHAEGWRHQATPCLLHVNENKGELLTARTRKISPAQLRNRGRRTYARQSKPR